MAKVGKILPLFLALFSLFSLANAGDLSAPFSPGDHTINLTYGERERSALIHVPPHAPEKQRLPVIFSFHGGGGSGASQQRYSMMDQLADRETFITVYPNGTGRFENHLLTEVYGAYSRTIHRYHRCEPRDVEFFLALHAVIAA